MSKAWDERWVRYDRALKAASVPGKFRVAHRGWLEGLLKAIRPKKWWAMEIAEVEEFLREMERKGRPGWQREQASVAFRIFFQEVEPAPWATPWPVMGEISIEISPRDGLRDQGAVPPSSRPLLTRMERVLEIEPYAARTRLVYLSWIRRFLAFRALTGEVQPEEAGAYLDYLTVHRQIASGTRAQAANALRLFYREVVQRDMLLPSVPPVPRRRSPRVLTEIETAALLQALPEGSNRTLALLLSTTGMRLAEAVVLRVRDIDFPGQVLVVGGGATSRPLPLPASLAEPLAIHWEGVQRLWQTDQFREIQCTEEGNAWQDFWVFPSDRVKVTVHGLRRPHIHPQSFQQLLARAARRAGLSQTTTPQTLRHSFAFRSLQSGMDIRALQTALGHADLSSTFSYVP